jgi:hypothetical protein
MSACSIVGNPLFPATTWVTFKTKSQAFLCAEFESESVTFRHVVLSMASGLKPLMSSVHARISVYNQKQGK